MRPHVIIHTAISLDGRTDRFLGDVGLYYEVAAKLDPDATLTGSNTLLKAGLEPDGDDLDPLLEKGEGGQLLVVTDSQGRICTWRRLQNQPYWGKVIVLCSDSTPKEYLSYLERVKVGVIQTKGLRVDLTEALEVLHRDHGVRTVRVDSGGALASALIREKLADELVLMIYPYLLGGTSQNRFFIGPEVEKDEEVPRLELARSQRLRGGVELLRYRFGK
jgi:2,5-diamino-6-(ribosylamino)-4(3H)-pyrimidinone 5'-phosphate reductase